MKDDLETSCMNELFGSYKPTKAQVYVKSDDTNTSILVARGNTVYFKDVLDVPEITGIQRGVSFVKHELDTDITEIYPDKLDVNEVLKDVYINYCKVGAVAGIEPNDKMLKLCETELNIHNRWNLMKGNQR